MILGITVLDAMEAFYAKKGSTGIGKSDKAGKATT